MALDPAAASFMKFQDFDLTLTDRELDDFLCFMEHQTTGASGGMMGPDALPQLPDVAMDFPGLQLQPHSGSPSRSEEEGSAGGAATGTATGGATTASKSTGGGGGGGSLTSAATGRERGEGANGLMPGAGSSGALQPLDISSQQQQQFNASIKSEEQQLMMQHQQQHLVQLTACSSLPGVLAASAGSAAAGGVTSLAGTLPMDPNTGMLMASCPTTLDMTAQSGMCMQPIQWHSSTAITPLAATTPATAAMQQPHQHMSQPLPQLVFVQPPPQQVPGGMVSPGSAQQMTQQMAAFAGLASPTSSTQPMERQASAQGSGGGGGGRASRQLQQLQQAQQQQQRAFTEGGCSSGKPQISHSTVEKQRRDRLNSLIDELSDMVPPADPKYGSDTNSVRRPKHVVLADTINLLKAMQTKLQIEEAEISTLKQHAAAVGAMAAQHHTGHAAVPEAADAMMHAAAVAAAGGGGQFSPARSPVDGSGAGAGGGGGACAPFDLPTAPEGGATATGVLVEQGIGCLYVKVNCKDRKGLLSDVVSALRAFPIVISTAAITTTRDGSVHDVFEVRIEDPSVTAEDIQFAVQQALYAAQRAAHTKRLRRDASGSLMQQ